jgi:hypothetical protein
MARRRLSQDKLQNRHEIVRRFREENDSKPSTTEEMAEWAIKKGYWKPRHAEVRKQLAEELSQAMREEYITDPQKRRVRVKHAARTEQGVLWVDIRDKRPDTHDLLEISFQNRRQLIVNDCRQLKKDIDSYNENWNSAEMIQSHFDFNDDLAEFEIAEGEQAKTAKA